MLLSHRDGSDALVEDENATNPNQSNEKFQFHPDVLRAKWTCSSVNARSAWNISSPIIGDYPDEELIKALDKSWNA